MSSSRRLVLSRSATLIAAASTGLLLPEIVRAQGAKVRIGLMLPYTGTFAQLGVAIENGLRLAIDEQGGKLGGREIEWFKVDDESDPSKGVENATKLVQRDKVDVIIGTVHSGVQMGIQKVARDAPADWLDQASGGLPLGRLLDPLEVARATASGPGALLVVDVDRFRDLNQYLGHEAADEEVDGDLPAPEALGDREKTMAAQKLEAARAKANTGSNQRDARISLPQWLSRILV